MAVAATQKRCNDAAAIQVFFVAISGLHVSPPEDCVQ